MSNASSISIFFDSPIQDILALFLTKPNLYKDYSIERDRQGYFFAEFRKFAANYYHFTSDENVYFMSTRKELAGEANICGGAGKMSGASSRYFKGRYKSVEDSREKQIDDFAKKYGVRFEPGNDPRLFLGTTEIWNKLDRAMEIVASSKWADICSQSYEDESFKATIPTKLEKHLVPFAIRNRAVQKHRNVSRSSYVVKKVPVQEEEEEETTRPYVIKQKIVIPAEFYEDW